MGKEGRGGPRWLGWFLVLPALVGSASAERLREVSRAQYGEELRQMSVAVESCGLRAGACAGEWVPADEKVQGGSGESLFEVHWGWLREALKKGGEGENKDRAAALGAAGARLAAERAALAEVPEQDSGAALRKASEVLGRSEFRTVTQNSWWQQKLALAAAWLDEFFGRAVGAVPWAPWMTELVEWGLLAGAVVALAVWVLRAGRQQRTGVAHERGVGPVPERESEDWAARAGAEAAAGNWREAVHCLYWSAIAMLEGQRLWRQNRARTPREYVELLEAGSARRVALGGLTGVFERIWYGIRPATVGDYEKARALLEQLRVGG